jgi:hypothetical protein
MAVVFQFNRYPTATLESLNPVLADGELWIEECIDGSKKTKIGDGSTRWNSLTYSNLGTQGTPGTNMSQAAILRRSI